MPDNIMLEDFGTNYLHGQWRFSLVAWRGTRWFYLQYCRCQICWKNLVLIICMYDQCGQLIVRGAQRQFHQLQIRASAVHFWCHWSVKINVDSWNSFWWHGDDLMKWIEPHTRSLIIQEQKGFSELFINPRRCHMRGIRFRNFQVFIHELIGYVR